MIRWLWKWVKRAVLGVVVLVVLLLMPVGYNELACRGDAKALAYQPILPPEHHRNEARTLMTYPEWHIVHAYDDYAKVLETSDPHDYGYIRGVRGFWSSLCDLSQQADAHGGFSNDTKSVIYVIGVSFTAELALKAAYEETVGRVFAWLRGVDHSPLDKLSAIQARGYAKFLQQVPWYRWDFAADAAALGAANSGSLRDRERNIALGLEFSSKAQYARAIGAAVASGAPDALRLRMIVQGADASAFTAYPSIKVIGARSEGLEIDTPRYRELTHLLAAMADAGVEFVEIAGNDEIMMTVTSPSATSPHALTSLARQGYGDYRHLEKMRVSALAARLREIKGSDAQLEHIHDY